MKRMLSILLVVSVLVSVVRISSVFAGEKKPKIIRVGDCYGGGYGKPYAWAGTIGIVHVKGWLEEEFKNEGIKIDWYHFKAGGPAANESFANGNIDFAAIGDLPAIIGKAGGLKTKLIAAHEVKLNSYIGVPIDSEITKISDLKGKKVAISKGTASQLTFNRILAEAGLTEKDIKIYNLSGADINTALASKDIDAAGIGLTGFNLKVLGLVKIIYSTKDNPVDWKVRAGIVVTENFANDYPDITKRVVKVFVKAAKWASDEKNREEVFKIWANSGVPLAAYKEEYEGDLLKDRENPLFTGSYVNHIKNAVTFSKERGIIRNTFDVDKWIDRSYLESALKELGLENFWSSSN